MGMKLGLAVATMTFASVLAIAPAVTASPDDPPATDPPTTDEPSTGSGINQPATIGAGVAPRSPGSTTTTAPGSTTTTTTTTTIPAAVAGGVDIDAPSLSAPKRSATQTQLVPPPPPPTTQPPPPPPGALPLNSGTGRRAVYSKSQQMVWAVDSSGNVIKNHLVSGKRLWCDPRVGTYNVFSRSRYTFALQNPSIIWGYMVRFAKGCNGGNIGFHEIPFDTDTGRRVQSVSQLGTPLSGGCVRQSIPDAIWMWNWAYIGTKVVVLP